MRSHGPTGSASVTRSRRRTSNWSSEGVRNRETSRSVATTRPADPTCVANQAAIDPPPAPSSRHRHPGATPIRPRCPVVTKSKASSNASKRATVSSRAFVRRYSDSPTASRYVATGACTEYRFRRIPSRRTSLASPRPDARSGAATATQREAPNSRNATVRLPREHAGPARSGNAGSPPVPNADERRDWSQRSRVRESGTNPAARSAAEPAGAGAQGAQLVLDVADWTEPGVASGTPVDTDQAGVGAVGVEHRRPAVTEPAVIGGAVLAQHGDVGVLDVDVGACVDHDARGLARRTSDLGHRKKQQRRPTRRRL